MGLWLGLGALFRNSTLDFEFWAFKCWDLGGFWDSRVSGLRVFGFACLGLVDPHKALYFIRSQPRKPEMVEPLYGPTFRTPKHSKTLHRLLVSSMMRASLKRSVEVRRPGHGRLWLWGVGFRIRVLFLSWGDAPLIACPSRLPTSAD